MSQRWTSQEALLKSSSRDNARVDPAGLVWQLESGHSDGRRSAGGANNLQPCLAGRAIYNNTRSGTLAIRVEHAHT